MGTNEFSQPASKSSWDSQDFSDISMGLKMAHFRKSTGPRWVKQTNTHNATGDIKPVHGSSCSLYGGYRVCKS